jgi:PilZ domain-containing protein
MINEARPDGGTLKNPCIPTSAGLQGVAQAVVSRARSEGFVVPRTIRQELAQAGMPDGQWKDVLALVRPQLGYRRGRYYFVPPMAARMRQAKRNQQAVHRAVRQLLGAYKKAVAQYGERREQFRFPFCRPVTVYADDGRELHLFSRDISASGIRLIGTYNLLGQRVRCHIAADDGDSPSWCFLVQILWASEAGDSLFENGGIFVELANN